MNQDEILIKVLSIFPLPQVSTELHKTSFGHPPCIVWVYVKSSVVYNGEGQTWEEAYIDLIKDAKIKENENE